MNALKHLFTCISLPASLYLHLFTCISLPASFYNFLTNPFIKKISNNLLLETTHSIQP